MVIFFKKAGLIFFLLLSLLQTVLYAQLKFISKATPSVIGKNEFAELKLLVQNATLVQQIDPPLLKGFVIISGPNNEISSSGQFIGISYLIKPTSTGNFTIPPANARADGIVLESNELNITVKELPSSDYQNNSAPPGETEFMKELVATSFDDFILRKNENVNTKINKNIFIKVEANKMSCYVGEPVVVTYKLYTRLKSESNITRSPSFNGFSVVDLMQPGNTFYKTEKLNGRLYNVYTLRKSQLYPLQAGPIELESAEIENTIQFIKQDYVDNYSYSIDNLLADISHQMIPSTALQNENVLLKSKPLIIQVNPLPEEKKPASFNGAVGSFILTASVNKTNFTTDDAAILKIALAGQGNLTLVSLPDIAWPPGVESFEPKVVEDINKLVVPLSGSRIFNYSFSVAKEGSYKLPPFEFSFFDANSGTYKTAFTSPINFIVSKRVEKKAISIDTIEKQSNKGLFFDFIFTQRWVLVIPISLLIITGLFFWWRSDKKKHQDIQARERFTTKEIAGGIMIAVKENPLQIAGEMLKGKDSKGFYEAINKELRNFICIKLQMSSAEFNKKEMVAVMESNAISGATIERATKLLDEIELQLYSPITDENKQEQMYERFALFIKEMNI